MAQAGDKRRVEHAIDSLKAPIGKYLKEGAHLTPEVVADLTKAIHGLSNHLVDLHRRIEKIEETHDEWTTRGWMPPPGMDRPS